MLHRLILAQCSGFFEAGTSEEWARAQAGVQASGLGDADTQSTLLAGIAEDEDPSRDFRIPPAPTSRAQEKLRWRYELDMGNNEDEIPMLVQKVGSLWLQSYFV